MRVTVHNAVTISIAMISLVACQNFDTTRSAHKPSTDGPAVLGGPNVDEAAVPAAPELSITDFTNLGWTTEQILEYKRNSLVGTYLKVSDALCGEYLQSLTRTQRSYSLILGSLSTIFGGAGAAFTSASVVRPLSALASIASGERAEFDADTFAKQTAQVIVSAIKNSRARTYNSIVQVNFPKSIFAWPTNVALADVQDYHSRCSLNEGVTEAAASITAVAPVSTPQPMPTDGANATGVAGRSESPPSSNSTTTAIVNGAAQGVAATRNATPAQVANAISGAVAAANAAISGNAAPSTPPPILDVPNESPHPAPAPPIATRSMPHGTNVTAAATLARAQVALVKAGTKIMVDGLMGNNTEAALEQFQRTRSPPLPPTGIVDAATIAALGINPPITIPVPASPALIANVQQLLLQNSSDVQTEVPGLKATGIIDTQTVAALIVYQSSKGLPQTGVIDAPTLSSLGVHS